MAEKKKPAKKAATPRISADRAEMLRKGKTQAGKPKAAGSSKAATITRQMQNKGVKDGTIRLGKSGKSYNVYDANTGTWKRGVVSAAAKPKPKPKTPAKPATPKKKSEKKGWGWHEPMLYYYKR